MKIIFDLQKDFDRYLDFIDEVDNANVKYCFSDCSCPTFHGYILPCKECFRIYGKYEIKES